MKSSRLNQLFLSVTLLVFVCANAEAQPGRGGPLGGGDRRGGGDRFGGGERGGAPGGGDRFRGGDRGGGDRSRGGDRGGGFDPSAMLRRLDQNGDGTLSPNETEGRARFFIERFVPGVDLSKPISIEKLGKEAQKARAARESGSGEVEGPEPLVPGFDIEADLAPVLGFGMSDEFFDVETNEDDRKEARQVLGRYDRDKDGRLNREEVNRGRWRDDPWQYDQNKDSVITERELMVRYALRRLAREGDRDRDNRRRRDDDDRDRDKDDKRNDEDDRGSYRFATPHERLPKATPDWFIEKDLNQDGQVMMFEYASKWDEETASEFDKWDLNRDGVIVPREAINSPDDSEDSSTDNGGKASSKPKVDAAKAERYRKYAAGIITKYDKNGDGQLSESEYNKMRRPPKDADRDGNKRITVDELTEALIKG